MIETITSSQKDLKSWFEMGNILFSHKIAGLGLVL